MGTEDTTEGNASSSMLSRLRLASSCNDLKCLGLWRGCVAEFIGTLVLVAIATVSCDPKGSITSIALCFGFTVGVVVWAIGHVSGGHINPAVTMGMLITRRISLLRALVYIIFQMLGAIAGSGLAYLMTGKHRGMTELSVPAGRGFLIEACITFVLVFTVFAACDGHRTKGSAAGGEMAPLKIGLSVTLCHIPFIPFTGSSMNPARSFGPAVMNGRLGNFGIYFFGPIAGGIVAGLLYEWLFASNASVHRIKAWLLCSDYKADQETYIEEPAAECI